MFAPLSYTSDVFAIRQQPRRLFERYFHELEAETARLDVRFELVPPEKLVAVYEAHAASWNGFSPVFDYRTTDVPPDLTACLVGYDRNGEPAVAHGCRLFEFGEQTVQSAFEDLTFWYGSKAEARRAHTVCTLTAPTAARMTGRVLYIGAFWVRPDFRNISASPTIQELARVYGCSRWDFDAIVTVGSDSFRRPELQARYGFDGYEDDFRITMHGECKFKGLFLWCSRDSQIARTEALMLRYEQEKQAFDHAGTNDTPPITAAIGDRAHVFAATEGR